MDQHEKNIARDLFEIGVFKDKSRSPEGQGFKLKLHEKDPDAPLSPFYMDLRMIQSFPYTMYSLVQVLESKLHKIGILNDRLAPISSEWKLVY